MRMRGILNLVLVVVVAALALLLVYRPGKQTKPDTPELPITDIKPSQVKSIRIQAKGQDEARLMRGKNGWRLTAPIAFRADDSLIGSVLGDFDETSQTRYATKSLDLSKYGLDKPALKVWLNDTELDFGDTNPLNGRRYIRVGDSVYLATDSLYDRLTVPPLTFAAKRLLPEGAEITAVHLPDVTVTRGTDGHWQAKPEPAQMAKGAPKQLVDAWQGVYAMRVSRTAKSDKTDAAAAKVSIEVKGRQSPLIFDVLKNDDKFLIARPNKSLVYHVSSGSRGQMLTLKKKANPKKKKSKG